MSLESAVSHDFYLHTFQAKKYSPLEKECETKECQGVFGLELTKCTRQCISQGCYDELYAWDEVSSSLNNKKYIFAVRTLKPWKLDSFCAFFLMTAQRALGIKKKDKSFYPVKILILLFMWKALLNSNKKNAQKMLQSCKCSWFEFLVVIVLS